MVSLQDFLQGLLTVMFWLDEDAWVIGSLEPSVQLRRETHHDKNWLTRKKKKKKSLSLYTFIFDH